MLPRETSIRQLKTLRQQTKGTDIGDLTTNDRLNKNLPNLQYIGNPVDMGIESWDEFSKKDSSLQTIAFKSKTVNKPLVNKKKKKTMNECENILKFNDFEKNWKAEEPKKTKRTEVGKDIIKENLEFDSEREEIIDLILNSTEVEREFLEEMSDEELEEIINNLELDNEGEIEGEIEDIDELSSDDDIYHNAVNDDEIKTFESFSVKPAPKEEKQPEYTILGKEKEPKSNPNFGIGEVKSQQIKKITDFNVIDPATPKERAIGGNAGVYIDNDIMSGRVNRIEGKNVYIESPDDPLTIKKFSLKDAVKLKKD
jgi:hypothetical protein